MIDYNTLTPEQAAKAARAETLKEIISYAEKCKVTLINGEYGTSLDRIAAMEDIINYAKAEEYAIS